MESRSIADLVKRQGRLNDGPPNYIEEFEKQPKRAIIYARVSRDEQGKDGKISLDQQVDRCQEYARLNNMVVVGIFKEDYTGKKVSRPEMNKVMKIFREGGADCLLVMRNDRFHRKNSVFWALHEQLLEYEVELHFTDTGMVDENNAASMLMVGVQNVMSEDERRKIVSRLRDAKHDMVRMQGVPIMGIPAYGLMKVGKNQLAIDTEKADIVRQIFYWLAYGNSESGHPITARSVASWLDANHVPINTTKNGKDKLGFWNVGSIVKMIRNPIYCGHYFYGKTRLVDEKKYPVPPEEWKEVVLPPELCIVDEDTWKLANERLDGNFSQSMRTRKIDYLLTNGHILCGTCGRRMTGHTCGLPKKNNSGEIQYYRRYQCVVWSRKNLGHKACSTKGYTISANMVEEVVAQWLRELVENPDDVQEALLRVAEQQEKPDLSPVYERLDAIRRAIVVQENNITEYLSSLSRFRDNPRLKAAIEEQVILADATRQDLEAQEKDLLHELESQNATVENLKILFDLAPQLREKLDSATFEDLVWLIDALNVKVTIFINPANSRERWLEISCIIGPAVYYQMAYHKRMREAGSAGPWRAEELGPDKYPIKMGESV